MTASAAAAAVAADKSKPGVLLDCFLRVYAQRCQEANMPMCPRASLAAALMLKDSKTTADIPSLLSPLPCPLSSSSSSPSSSPSSSSSSSSSLSFALHAVPLGADGSGALFFSLALFPLAALDLRACYLGDSGARLLAAAFAAAPRPLAALRRLVLRGVGATDAAPLALLVAAAAELRALDVSGNRLGAAPAGFAALCGAMRGHAALREVDARENALCGTCAGTVAAIAEWIVCAAHADALRRVDLRHNVLGFAAAPDAAAVGRGKMLYGAHPFVDALMFNNTLEALELAGNALPEDVLHVVEAKLAVNRRTQERMRKNYLSEAHVPGSVHTRCKFGKEGET